ncbi:TatD family hydrolase [Kistimonas asteriae]|uniref:TatD family hydrolase n=1 Tax=Kistimonas asteriae TaxID=517724 RepID=UPI001BAB3052|nr:TatD family hydrolase [Kistimonas asteriae]
MLFDSHCHFDFKNFDSDRQIIMDDCAQKRILALCIPSTTATRWQLIIDLAAAKSPISLYFALGLHPYFLEEHNASHLEALEQQLCLNPKHLMAVGEIGIDFYLDHLDRDQQESLFRAQVKIAKAHKLPIILHARKSHDQILKILRELHFQEGGIVHAWSGSEQQANRFIEMGFKLGFGGAITYPRATKLRHLAATLPLTSLVLETDAPDMAPAAFKGQRNSPEYLPLTLDELCLLRPESAEIIARQTTQNTMEVLRIQSSQMP